MKKLVCLLLFAVALQACNQNQPEQDGKKDTHTDDTSPRLEKLYTDFNLIKDKNLVREVKLLRKKVKFIYAGCITENQHLYITTTSRIKTEERTEENNYATIIKNRDFGLVDKDGKVVLKNVYQRIGNPGAIASGYMELKRDGKYGLYDYINNILTEPQFDVIFPTGFVSYAAIGRKIDTFYKIYADGSIKEVTNEKEIPSYHRLGDKRNFDIQDKRTALFTLIPEEDNTDYEYGSYGVIFPPSYQVQLGILPEIIDFIKLEGNEFGIITAKSKNTDRRSNAKRESFIELLEQEIEEVRSDEIQRSYQLVSVGKNTRIEDSRRIADYYYSGFFCDQEKQDAAVKVSYLNDSRRRNFLTYNEGTCYSYYSITASGKIKTLFEKSIFPMASVVQLNEHYFKGAFYSQPEDSEDEEDRNTALTRFLSAADLQYMRNEIYARHGYIFGDKKWKELFMPFDWYKPVHTNVDKFLTPVEKSNLKIIREWEDRLQQNEDKYLQKEMVNCGYAG